MFLYKQLGTLALLLAVTGCTTIHTYVPNWPEMKVTEHVVSVPDMLSKCYPGVPLWLKLLGGIPMGCAEFNFAYSTCDIYITGITPEFVVEHERAHCRGGDHFGELQDAFDRWNLNLPAKKQ